MRNIKKDYIEKLIDIMRNNGLTELSLEDNDSSITIKGNDLKPIIKEKTETNVDNEIELPTLEEEPTLPTQEQIEKKENIVPIVSNMIGIYYSKPSPKDKPFVKIGDIIEEDDVICIIETIKLVNKVTADVSGKIVEICIEDGKPVEYGQVIMYVEKD